MLCLRIFFILFIEKPIYHCTLPLKDIQCWCIRHKLTIHTGKTKVLLIIRQKFIGPLNELKFGDTPIEYVAEAKCLGVTLDQKLSWQPQINYVTKSFNAKVKQLKEYEMSPKGFPGDLFQNYYPISYLLLGCLGIMQ